MRKAPSGGRGRFAKAALVAGATALVLSACTGTGASGSEDGKVTLTFLNHYGSEPMKGGLSKLIDEWNSSHPDIQVKQQTVDFNDLLTTLNVRQTGGKGADILSSYSLWAASWRRTAFSTRRPRRSRTTSPRTTARQRSTR